MLPMGEGNRGEIGWSKPENSTLVHDKYRDTKAETFNIRNGGKRLRGQETVRRIILIETNKQEK
jgi:hypothetical protein